VELCDAEVCADSNCRPPDDVNTVLPKAQGYKVDGPGTEYIRGWGLGVYWPREKVRHLKGCVRMADG